MNSVNFDHVGFDRLARPYRYLEYLTFGPILQRTRTHCVKQLNNHSRALVLGDGDGRFTAQLLKSNPQVQVHAVDISPRMLQSLYSCAGLGKTRLTTEVADLREWGPDPAASYDLIVTHFLLDCLTTSEIARLAHCLCPAVLPHAQWLVSEFAIPPTKFGRLIAAPLVAFLYQAFRVLTHLEIRRLPDHPLALQSAGWSLQSQHFRLKGLLVSQLWSRNSAAPAEAP